jgi:hypothetical protein
MLKQLPKPATPVLKAQPPTSWGGGNTFFQTPTGQRNSNESFGAAAAGQAAKDQAAFSAMGNLGIAGQNAMGQYGMNRDAQLTNQAIAAANAYGSMANAHYNTMGQLGSFGAALTASGLNAGAQAARGTQSNQFNMGMGGGGGGGFGGGPGFFAGGPEGAIARGGYGGGGGFGFGGNVSGGGGMHASVTKGASSGERQGMLNQGYGFLGGLRDDLNNRNSPQMQMANRMDKQFGASRAAVMDPTIVNSLNSQMNAGYGALGGLYGRSDYGFNTQNRMPKANLPQARDNSQFWLDPYGSKSSAGTAGRMGTPQRRRFR